MNTMGIVAVAAFAASTGTEPPQSQRSRPPSANQIGRHRWQPIVLTLRPPVFDRHVLAPDIADFLQAMAERSYEMRAMAPAMLRNPITGIAGCCALAASGHAAARRRAA